MSDQAPAVFQEARCRAYAIAALAPFFVADDGAAAAAEATAREVLEDYRASTPRQIQLAAEVIALGWATLACLRAAVAATGLAPEEMLTLHDEALKLERMSRRASKALEASRGRETAESGWDEGAFQLTLNRALEAMNRANRRLGLLPGEPEGPAVPKRRRAAAGGPAERKRGVRAGRSG